MMSYVHIKWGSLQSRYFEHKQDNDTGYVMLTAGSSNVTRPD